MAQDHPHLNRAQKDLIEEVLSSTDRVQGIQGFRLGPVDRVLLIGDIRQDQGVEAGRSFEQLQQAGTRTAKLDEIVGSETGP